MHFEETDGHDQAGREVRGASAGSPVKSSRRCRVDGCDACLLKEKKFYRRSRCCQNHARELRVMLDGEARRFCQQCCGFHDLAAFDGTKRSCRERLEAHNTRQREKWTVGGRRRGKGDEGQDTAEVQQPPPPPPQLQRILSADQSAAASTVFCGDIGDVSMQQHPEHPQQEYAVSFEGVRRSTDLSPWESPPLNIPQAPGGAIIGGMSPGVGGSPSMRPPRNRRPLRSKSDKTGIWATALTDEHQALWQASGAAVQPRACPPAPLAHAGGSGTYVFDGASAGGQHPGEWSLFKHNSLGPGDVAMNDALQQQDWQRRNALKRLSVNSQAGDANPFKRASLEQPLDREGSDASAASGGWPVRQRGAEAAARLATSVGETLKPADLGLHNVDEARAFAEQAPDPLWLAQRLIGAELAVKTRPEYSYGRQFRGRSMDSATAHVADSLDAVAARVRELSRLSGPRGQGQLWAEAAQQPLPPVSQSAQDHFQPLAPPPQQQQQWQAPNAFARVSGPAAFAPDLVTDVPLISSGWDTNEGTLPGAMVPDAFMAEARQGMYPGAQPNAAGWPQLQDCYSEFDAGAAAAGGWAAPRGFSHSGLPGQHSLAAVGQQFSAPPLMQR